MNCSKVASLIGGVLALVVAERVIAAQAPAPPIDPALIVRFDPLQNQMVPVPPAEIKPGFLYNHFNARLNRRVWSLATEGGRFQYAMAPGSVMYARALDLRATPAQLRETLNARAPDLAKMLDVRGALACVRLLEDGTWTLVRQPTIANVFDLETGRRWEWHGERRVAVVHTGGYEWALVNGGPVPVTVYPVMSAAMCW